MMTGTARPTVSVRVHLCVQCIVIETGANESVDRRVANRLTIDPTQTLKLEMKKMMRTKKKTRTKKMMMMISAVKRMKKMWRYSLSCRYWCGEMIMMTMSGKK